VIVGLGIELVDLARFEMLLERYGDRMRARLFTEDERKYAARKVRGAESLAARFAAKVAARLSAPRTLRAAYLRSSSVKSLARIRSP